MRPWTALFSKTGSELKRLCDTLNVWPTNIITNNFNEEEWSSNIPPELVTIMNTEAIHNGLKFTKKNDVITLHGYMNIIPADVCDINEIYNGHPGAVNLYPELKGKDPQEKAWNNRDKYEYVGSVIHKVTSEVDGGEIVGYVYTDNDCQSKEEMYNVLRDCSYEAWIDFLREKVLEIKNEEYEREDITIQ